MSPPVDRRRRFTPWGILCGIIAWLLLLGLEMTGLAHPVDNVIRDQFFMVRGSRPAHPSIALVEVDDATVRAYGTWPIPRDQYALLIEALNGAGARAIGFDILFADADHVDSLNDVLLADETRLNGNVVHSMTAAGAGTAPYSGAGEDLYRNLVLPGGHIEAMSAQRVILPFPDLLESTHALGHIAVILDEDAAIRRLPLFVRHGNSLFPCLAVRLAGYALGDSALPAIHPRQGGYDVVWPGSVSLRVWLDRDLATGFVYSGDRESFQNIYSLLDVLRAAGSSDSLGLREAFAGRIVLVGSTATGEAAADVGVTPFNSRTPRFIAQANVLDAVLRGDLLRGAPATAVWSLLLIVAILSGVVFKSCRTIVCVPLAIGVAVALGAGVYAAFVVWNLLLPCSAILALPLVVLLISSVVRFVARERETRIRDAERAAARSIQKSLLPTLSPRRPDLDVAGFNRPARDVGGDYYDWQENGNGDLLFALGDVSGKGMPAALLLSHLQANFRSSANRPDDPAAMAKGIHEFLMKVMPPGRFATLFLGRITPENGLTFSNAGHSPGFLVRDGRVIALDVNGGAIGLFADTIFSSRTIDLDEGDWIVLYSDGLTDVRWGGELYGEDRLKDLVASLSTRMKSAAEFCRSIVAEVDRHGDSGEPIDDLTLVVVGVRSVEEG